MRSAGEAKARSARRRPSAAADARAFAMPISSKEAAR
jgi:hypothetical protein